jgi:hypothetical protein
MHIQPRAFQQPLALSDFSKIKASKRMAHVDMAAGQRSTNPSKLVQGLRKLVRLDQGKLTSTPEDNHCLRSDRRQTSYLEYLGRSPAACWTICDA